MNSFLLIDMGEYSMPEFPELEAKTPRLGGAILQGLHLMQVLPTSLERRASAFPSFLSMHQVEIAISFISASDGSDFVRIAIEAGGHCNTCNSQAMTTKTTRLTFCMASWYTAFVHTC